LRRYTVSYSPQGGTQIFSVLDLHEDFTGFKRLLRGIAHNCVTIKLGDGARRCVAVARGRAVDTDVCLIQVRFCVPADQRNYCGGSLLVTAHQLLANTVVATFSIIAFYLLSTVCRRWKPTQSENLNLQLGHYCCFYSFT
jgi:hypothetical protein